jgi:hypothetical protein
MRNASDLYAELDRAFLECEAAFDALDYEFEDARPVFHPEPDAGSDPTPAELAARAGVELPF